MLSFKKFLFTFKSYKSILASSFTIVCFHEEISKYVGSAFLALLSVKEALPDVLFSLSVEAFADIRFEAQQLEVDGVANLLQVFGASHTRVGLKRSVVKCEVELSLSWNIVEIQKFQSLSISKLCNRNFEVQSTGHGLIKIRGSKK